MGRPLCAYAYLEVLIGLCGLAMMPTFNAPEPVYGLLPLTVVELVNRYAGSFGLLHLSEFLMAFGLMFLPTFAAGGIFPTVTKLYTRHLATVGKSVGTAYAANTLGAVLGAFAGGFLLIPLIGVQASILAANTLNIGLGIYFLWRDGLFSRLLFRVLAPGLTALAPSGFALPCLECGPAQQRPVPLRRAVPERGRLAGQGVAQAIGQGRRLLYAEEGMTATVTVWDLCGERFMRVNGKVVASSQGKDLRSHSLLAHLPLLLHEDPQQVLIIGLGCGISLGAAQLHPVAAIDCVELSPEVVEATELFSEVNQDALADDRRRRPQPPRTC